MFINAPPLSSKDIYFLSGKFPNSLGEYSIGTQWEGCYGPWLRSSHETDEKGCQCLLLTDSILETRNHNQINGKITAEGSNPESPSQRCLKVGVNFPSLFSKVFNRLLTGHNQGTVSSRDLGFWSASILTEALNHPGKPGRCFMPAASLNCL